MSTPIYHYTTGDRFLRIIASRAIQPATAHVAPPEIPAVWLSSAPVWEPSATKGVIEDGVRRQASLAELIVLCGCLVRIEIDPARVRLLGPSDFSDALRIPPGVRQRLFSAGLEMGADPADWSAVAGPVPLTSFRRIEFTIESEPPHWIPWPGIRLRASSNHHPIHPNTNNQPHQLPSWPLNLSQIIANASASPAIRLTNSVSPSRPSW